MKISIRLIILFIYTCKQISSQWRIVSELTGTLPSGIYSFNLKPGDTISASLNWSGSDNLDFYLDEKSSSFPGNNVRAANGYSRPEIMSNYVASKTATYSFVLQYANDIPKEYEFSVTLNGQITTYKDHAKLAQNGYSVKALVLSYSCRIKIVY